jgi:hypothetical protein
MLLSSTGTSRTAFDMRHRHCQARQMIITVMQFLPPFLHFIPLDKTNVCGKRSSSPTGRRCFCVQKQQGALFSGKKVTSNFPLTRVYSIIRTMR